RAQQVARAEVAGVGGHRPLQRLGRRRILQQGGKSEAGARTAGAVVGGQVGGQAVQQRLGFRGRTGLQQRDGEVELEFVVVRGQRHLAAQACDLRLRVQRRR